MNITDINNCLFCNKILINNNKAYKKCADLNCQTKYGFTYNYIFKDFTFFYNNKYYSIKDFYNNKINFLQATSFMPINLIDFEDDITFEKIQYKILSYLENLIFS